MALRKIPSASTLKEDNDLEDSMKTKLALALLVLSANASAQKHRLGDLNFFQKKSSIYWNSELQSTKGESTYEFDLQDGDNDVLKNKFDTLLFLNRVNYGITDRLNAGIGFNYAIKNEVKNTSSTLNSTPGIKLKTFENAGLSDVTFNGNYRLLDQKFYLDFGTALTLAIGDREAGSATAGGGSKDGNFQQGHHSLNMTAAVGQKISAIEWRVRAALDYHLDGEYTSVRSGSSDVVFDTESYMNFLLLGQVQYRPLTDLAIAASIDYIIPADRELSASNQDVTLESENILTYGLTGKYNLTESILLKAGYQLVSEYQIDSKIKVFGFSNDAREKDINYQRFLVGAEFLF